LASSVLACSVATGAVVTAADAATFRGKRSNPARAQLASLAPTLAKPSASITPTQPAAPPMVAVVSLGAQSISIFSGTDLIAKAPISSGMDGHRTPTGVFSILQKNRYHESNLYNNAPMPFMQRLTWSGIALHAGRLPGYRASHGCVRLPDAFAERLFSMSKLGARVIITPELTAPVDIAHANLPAPIMTLYAMSAGAQPAMAPGVALAAFGPNKTDVAIERLLNPIQAAEIEKRRSAEAATEAQRLAKQYFDVAAAVAANADAAREERLAAEQAAVSYRDLARGAAAMLAAAVTDEDQMQADASQSAVADAIADADRAVVAARQHDAMVTAESFIVARRARDAEDAAERAETAARIAGRGTEPITVFVSRRENKVLVRQGFQTILEGDVSIRDADQPLGTHVFTAGQPTVNSAALRWTAVSVADSGMTRAGAAAALDRITIDAAIAPAIGRRIWTGATLIISDQGVSTETGKGTDFVVLTK
jgi:L,D-transpeptidase catalytic domain